MTTISVCMIVKNEEACLERCLNSIKDLADEIIIVDTGSTDKTVEIAKKFTEKIFDFEWIGDFSAARNFSIKQATKDWILVLDADEMIVEEDVYVIKDLVEKEDAAAYYLNQVDYVKVDDVNKYGIVSQNKELDGMMPFTSKPIARLFRNKKEIQFNNKIHEVINQSIDEKGYKLEFTNANIIHFIDDQKGGFGKDKLQNYLNIGLEQIKQTPNDPKAYSDVAKLHLIIRDLESAKKYLTKAIEIDNKDAESYYVLGRIYEWKNMIDDAVKCYRMSIKFNPNKTEAYIGLGTLLMSSKDFDKAIKVYEKAAENGIFNVFLLNNLAYLYSITNQGPKAIKIYENILNSGMRLTEPLKVKIINNLVNAFINLNRFENAIKILKKSRDDMPAELSFHNNLIKIFDYLKRTEEMLAAMEELDKAKKNG
ncbi:glycosyltransferase [Candidatus Woesearchaeota archaeon]|nr:glycosyltransferase [Candidatus Woesearchaeota archaeon]MBW3018410.1 glycosyltransferase [Candidatus Woesearchaeota archaeon]